MMVLSGSGSNQHSKPPRAVSLLQWKGQQSLPWVEHTKPGCSWVCPLCSSKLILWFQPHLARTSPFSYPASPTCQIPLMDVLQEPGGGCTERPASTINHITTSPLSTTNLYFPFLFSSWLSYRTYLPQIFVSWMLIKCPQVKKYLEINMDTSVAYAHFHKKLKHGREAQWARLITVFSIKHWH